MSFYEVLAQLSVTLLGLWWVVVQVRHSRAPSDRRERQVASAVSMHLALPALMSLSSLVDPESSTLWRWSFALFGTIGLVHLAVTVTRRDGAMAAAGPKGSLVVAAAAAVYLGVVAVAALADRVTDLAWELGPLELEGVLLTALLALQLAAAVHLLFEPATQEGR